MSESFKIDREAEAARIDRDVAALTPDPLVAQRVFRGARRLFNRRWQREDNWVVAMQLYGVGSTYAWAICRRIGIDPDSRAADPLPTAPTPSTPIKED